MKTYEIAETETLLTLYETRDRIDTVRSWILGRTDHAYDHVVDHLATILYDIDKKIKDELFAQYISNKRY